MKILKQNNSNIWFIVALEEEFYNKDANIIYTGVGKVNAALATQYLLDHFCVDKLINVGTAAGSNVVMKGEVYEIFHFAQREIWTNNKEKKEVSITKEYKNSLLTQEQQVNHSIFTFIGHIGTGDTFVYNMSESDYAVVDMEAFAIAYVCKENNKLDDFYCLKYISDGEGSENPEKDWEEALEKCNKKFNQYYNNGILE
jgi:adenosylhomocysteine nucleosidase